jgi:hypothetical protein
MATDNSETLKAINELKKNQKQSISTELSSNVSSFLGKPLEKIMSGRDATSYTSNSNFELSRSPSKNISYRDLLKNVNSVKTSTSEQNLLYAQIQPTSELIDSLRNKISEISMRGEPLPENGFDRLQPYDQWEANFELYESQNVDYAEFNDSNNKADNNPEIKRLNTFANPGKVKKPEELKNAVVKAILYVSKSEYVSGNEDKNSLELYKSSYPGIPEDNTKDSNDRRKLYFIARSITNALTEDEYKKFISGYNNNNNFEAHSKKIIGRNYVKKVEDKDPNFRKYINAGTAALYPMSNLTGADVLADKEQELENIWDNSGGNWWYSSNKGSHNISEVIYGLYKSGSESGDKSGDEDFSESALLGADIQISPGFDIWSNNGVAAQLTAGGLNSKSTIGLVTDYLLDFKKNYRTRGNKLRAATVIGYRNYNASGRGITSYISVSPEVLPGKDEYEAKFGFSYGRGQALKKRMSDGTLGGKHTSNNYAIQAIYDSGPDFMANMFDMCIFAYKRGEVPSVSKAVKLATFNIGPNTPYKAADGTKVSSSQFKKGIPASQEDTLSLTESDFFTRVQNITIPEMKSSTIELKVLGQTLTKPIALMENDFTSSFTVEQDTGLEYMRLFNRLAGLSLMMEIDGQKPEDYTSNYGHYNNLFANRANSGNLKDGNGNFAIAVKLRTMHNAFIPYNNYIVFEDVKFLGGGQVNFKAGNAGLATFTQKFIYKNVGILPVWNSHVNEKIMAHTGTWAALGQDQNNPSNSFDITNPHAINGFVNPIE